MKGILFNNEFCENYFGISTSEATQYKISYLKTLVPNNRIYKFIQFDDNAELNETKINSLENESLWFSHSRFLNDPTEYQIDYSPPKVISRLKGNYFNKTSLDKFIGALQDVYELCSFTYETSEYMWEMYANNGNGLCIEFEVGDFDQLYPIIYADKSKVDFNKLISDSINDRFEKPSDLFSRHEPMSILPFILKNPTNNSMNSVLEKEIRILYAPTDNSEFNDGYIYKNSKRDLGYCGISVKYSKVKLLSKKVVIGRFCTSLIVERVKGICESQGIELSILNS